MDRRKFIKTTGAAVGLVGASAAGLVGGAARAGTPMAADIVLPADGDHDHSVEMLEGRPG